jgi:hypothetical protein
MRGVHLFLFLITLPVIAAIGYDLYLWYEHQDRPFQMTTPGWIWTQNDPESYKMVLDMVAPETWRWINFVLGQKTIAVTGAFAGVFYVLAFILKILGLWPFQSEKGAIYGEQSRKDKILSQKKKK